MKTDVFKNDIKFKKKIKLFYVYYMKILNLFLILTN